MPQASLPRRTRVTLAKISVLVLAANLGRAPCTRGVKLRYHRVVLILGHMILARINLLFGVEG